MLKTTNVFLSIITLLMVSAGAFAGCGSESTGTATGAGGSGGAAAASTGAGDAGGVCYGNQSAWETAIMEPLDCQKNSDCCLIVNGCTNAAQIVTVNKLSAAKASWPYCDSDCTFCTPPAVQVECANNKCVGYQLPEDPSTPNELRKAHCGEDGLPLMKPNPASQFICAG